MEYYSNEAFYMFQVQGLIWRRNTSDSVGMMAARQQSGLWG